MNNSNSQETGSHIVPVVAAFLSVSMSICFSRLVILGVYGPECLLTIAAIIVLYFLAFYAISKALYITSGRWLRMAPLDSSIPLQTISY